MINILTVDVEEYFHPSEVQKAVDTGEWSSLPSRVEESTEWILEALAEHRATATFFVLGWVAKRHPGLMRKIRDAGQEIGCHSYAHQLVYSLTPAEFRADTERAIRVIEDACGVTPRVYRAPSYSITKESLWALDILMELGFTHDSSIYPIAHDRYGIPGFNRFAHQYKTDSGVICEVPAATVRLAHDRVAPVGGGAYLRLLPYRYTAAGIRRLNEQEQKPACIYFHPWEIDPDQPRLTRGMLSRYRTYLGINGMKSKIVRLLTDFRFSSLTAVVPAPARPRVMAYAAAAR